MESRNISCYITVDFAKEEGYIVIKQLLSVHCSFLYFELVSTITEYKSLYKCCTLCNIRTKICLLLVCPKCAFIGQHSQVY